MPDTADELNAALEAQFAASAADPENDPEGTDGGSGTPEAPEGGTSPVPGADGGEGSEGEPRLVRIGDAEVPEEEVLALIEFQRWAQDNQDKMQAFGQFLRGEAEFVVRTKEEPKEPEKAEEPEIDWDLVDPQLRAAYEAQQRQIEELRKRDDEVRGPIEQWQQQQQEDARRTAEEAVQTATERVREKFKLTDQELDRLAADAASLGVVPGLRAQGVEPAQAIETALEMAFWKNDQLRQRVLDEQLAQRDAEDRKRRASTITGSGGSERGGVRSQAGAGDVPRDPTEKRAAMAAEIAESLRGTP